jgi:predicted alpha/beta-fold hydrolase
MLERQTHCTCNCRRRSCPDVPCCVVHACWNAKTHCNCNCRRRSCPDVNYRREFLNTADGGIVALDWQHFGEGEQDLPEDAPVLILLPGLTGGSGCTYVRHCVLRMQRAGIRSVVFNSRGTSDSPVTTPQFYSASFTGQGRRSMMMMDVTVSDTSRGV